MLPEVSEAAPIDTGETGPKARPPVDASLDEAEHQAFDLLAELPLAEPWIAARRGETARESLAAALDEHGETLDAIVAAEAIAGPALDRISARVARSLIEAATELVGSTEAGSLTTSMVAEASAALDAEPRLGGTLDAARETVGLCLGLESDSIAGALLAARGEDAKALGAPAWGAFAAALDERIHAAWPGDKNRGTALPLRVFRSATVVDAGVYRRGSRSSEMHTEWMKRCWPWCSRYDNRLLAKVGGGR